MKKIILLAFLLLGGLIVFGQTRVIGTSEGKVVFKKKLGQYILQLANGVPVIGDSSLVLVNHVFDHKGMTVLKTRMDNIGLLKIRMEADHDTMLSSFDTARADTSIISFGAVLEHPDGTIQGVTNRILCKIKQTTTEKELREVLKPYKIDTIIHSTDPGRPLNYEILVSKYNKEDAADLSDILRKSPFFQSADVDWIRFAKSNGVVSAPKRQWGIQNDGSIRGALANADMKVIDAWQVATGKDIRIALLDDGVDLNHPDLKANLVAGFDAVDTMRSGQPNPGDAHGTACAGIIAALNNDIGGVGVAYNAKLIPVRIGYGDQGHGPMMMRDAQVAKAIRWAATKGKADILSCSWSGGSSSGAILQELNDAISPKPGRRGLLVVFSAGNESAKYLSFPASVPGVIAVGASTMCDTRKTGNHDRVGVSCDRDGDWGSNYGPDLCVMAPGVQILTTDLVGPSGFSKDDYIESFGGTSAACPNVAGVLALILEIRPTLTAIQARQILEASADAVGGYIYANDRIHVTKKWCQDAGYGRVNALAAVQMAKIASFPTRNLLLRRRR